MSLSVPDVAAQRAQLWAAGFRPVPIFNHDATVTSPGKQPLGNAWQKDAREDPPFCARSPAVAHALNTGILCDGLRAIDIDIDDPDIACRCRSIVLDRFGETPVRWRRNSPRCLILYRAAEGEPRKVLIAGDVGKVEVLGKGQQFVAFGQHPTGAELEWFPDAPGAEMLDRLKTITEAEVHALLTDLAVIIGAKPPGHMNGHDHEPGEPQADPLRIGAALASIPNSDAPDWEWWNRIGMATWRATDGSPAGFAMWDAWSARNRAYDATATRQRWDHYATSPPTSLGAGTIFHLARPQRSEEVPEHDPAADQGYWDSLQADAAEQQDTTRHVPPESRDPGGLPLVYFHKIQANLNAADFVEDTLIEGGMSVVYGESNSGKTFFVSNLALHVAEGKAWCGKETEPSGVIYCALEGSHGISNRVAAYREHYNMPDDTFLPFAVIPTTVNLLHPEAHTAELIGLIRSAAKQMSVPVRLVVIDTLARALAGGNENASEDMGALVINTDRIRLATKAHVMFVHHSGKDTSRGARGHSSLLAATDTEIEVTHEDGEATRIARVTKQREMECSGEFGFSLHVVKLGTNRRGKDVTSCVVVDGEAGEPTKRRPKLTGHTKKALDILTNLLASDGKSGFQGAPSDVPSVPEEWWRERFYADAMPGASQDTKKRAFRRSADNLMDCNSVAMANGRVWMPYGE